MTECIVQALESEGHEGLHYSHSDMRRRAELVYIVWERNKNQPRTSLSLES